MKKILAAFCSAALLAACLTGPVLAFNDDAEITHTEAVELMVQLNLMQGTEETSLFRPNDPVTRAEMAKMLCTARNGGVAPLAHTDMPAPAVEAFSDMDGHWAAAYIGYCAQLGVIDGRGDGRFDPDAGVTGLECAKMLLVAIGYDSTYEGFQGADWAERVRSRADEAKLFDHLDGLDTSAPLTRDDAAQMVANGVQASLISYEYTPTAVDGDVVNIAVPRTCTPTETILSRYYSNQG